MNLTTLTRISVLLLWAIAHATPSLRAGSAALSVDAAHPGAVVSPLLYGIFFEEINCAGDGGLYAELVRNRSFEDSDKPEHWTLATAGHTEATIAIDSERPLSSANPHSLRLRITSADGPGASLVNEGYWGMNIIQGADYQLSLAVRCADGFSGPLKVRLESSRLQPLAQGQIDGLKDGWQTFKLNLHAAASDPGARLVIGASHAGTVWLDSVSLFPKRTWKKRSNGLRPDLAGMLAELHPAFVRFPGGCWVEGETLKYAYRWKQTIGNLGDRRNQYNIWQYHSTHGLGYHEYLQFCEDLHAEPLFVINCGMSHQENVPMNQMAEWVQDALDAIEYANGPVASHWGAIRARNGHPRPFHLKYMEIGNENGGPPYQERYALFYDAIKARYPDMHLVADVPTRLRPADIVDEHYYSNPQFFIGNADRYDSYNRIGPRIYVGEYAVTENGGQGNLRGALGEAAFMTGLERNADVVAMASYAPLFANVNYKRWNPDLINFNSSGVYGTPSYYVQRLFGSNRGDVVLPLKLTFAEEGPKEVPHGGIGVGTWETQAEYKDLKVVKAGQTLFASDFASGTDGWRLGTGRWAAAEGVLRQSAGGSDHRAIAGDSTWSDYTYSLKARKLSGREGFLVMFQVRDENNWIWWNLGGWGNARHALERCVDGGKSILGRDVAGMIETGRWYDVRIELHDQNIRCYLDGQLVHDASLPRPKPMSAVASLAKADSEVILKVVNTSATAQETQIELNGIRRVHSPAQAMVLTSANPADENSIAEPTKVAPVRTTVPNAAPKFRYTFPANSLTVLRLKVARIP